MNLWIRSQDKMALVKINSTIELKYGDRKTIIANYQPDFTDKYDGYYDVLGTYKTKERALEVLDEIQNILKPKYILDTSSIKPVGDFYIENGMIFQKYNANAKTEELSTFAYQMPKD